MVVSVAFEAAAVRYGVLTGCVLIGCVDRVC